MLFFSFVPFDVFGIDTDTLLTLVFAIFGTQLLMDPTTKYVHTLGGDAVGMSTVPEVG